MIINVFKSANGFSYVLKGQIMRLFILQTSDQLFVRTISPSLFRVKDLFLGTIIGIEL